jgi:hypothetical protein
MANYVEKSDYIDTKANRMSDIMSDDADALKVRFVNEHYNGKIPEFLNIYFDSTTGNFIMHGIFKRYDGRCFHVSAHGQSLSPSGDMFELFRRRFMDRQNTPNCVYSDKVKKAKTPYSTTNFTPLDPWQVDVMQDVNPAEPNIRPARRGGGGQLAAATRPTRAVRARRIEETVGEMVAREGIGPGEIAEAVHQAEDMLGIDNGNDVQDYVRGEEVEVARDIDNIINRTANPGHVINAGPG